MKKFLIGDIAKLLGVTPEALRHYERIGLVKPSYVAENGYRYYDTRGYTYLFFIKKYRSLGFTLQETEDLLYKDHDDKKLEKLMTRRESLLEELKNVEQQLASLDDFRQDIKDARSQIEKFDMVKAPALCFVPIRTDEGLCLSSQQINGTRAMMKNISQIQYTMLADLKRSDGILSAERTLGLSIAADNVKMPEGSVLIAECTALRAVINMRDGEQLVKALERTGVVKKLEELGIDMDRRIYGHMTNMSVIGKELYSTFRIFIPVDINS